MRTLTIISHTEHYKKQDGTVVGLGSTVTEINHLLEVFDKIVHLGMLFETKAPANALPYFSNRIRFVALPVVGGTSWYDKFSIIYHAPKILYIINKELKGSDYFQFRAPTGIGVFVIPFLTCFKSQKGWFKYAGNWNQKKAPLAYRFQRWLLKKQRRKVTINGVWKNQPKQCLTFENPCLTREEVIEGQLVIAKKNLQFPLILCFIGRLEAAKGLELLIDAIEALDVENRLKIGIIHLVGEGEKMSIYQKKIKRLNLPFKFHGYLSRSDVHAIYKQSHAILLPSASEGFPKVVAEAMNYGCIPIVSHISSIGQYIKHNENGFLLNNISIESIMHEIKELLKLSDVSFTTLIQHNSNSNIYKFTYNYYNQRVLKELIHNV